MAQPSLRIRPFRALESKFAINWRTHLIFVIPTFYSGIFNDLGRLGGDPTLWVLVTLLGYLLTVASIELMLQLVDRLGERRSAALVLGVLVIAGVTRGTGILVVGNWLEIVPQSDLAYRLAGAPIYVVSIYLIFNTVVTAFLEQRETERLLRNEKRTLAQSRLLFSEEIQRLRLELRSKVQQAIAPSLWEISKLLQDAKIKGDTSNLVSAIRSANENVVRPLSRSLRANPEPPTITTFTALARVGRLTLPKRITLGSSFSVFLLVAFSLALGYSTQAINVGLVQALFNLATAGGYYALVSYLLKYLTARIDHSTWLGLLISAPLGFAVGYSGAWFMDLEWVSFEPRFPLQAALFFGLSFPSVYLLAAIQVQRQITVSMLEQTVAALRILNSQLKQQVWLDQKLLATELHGSVQATLHATALSLAKNPKPSVKDLDAVMLAVEGVVGRLGDAAYLEGAHYRSVLEDIVLVWEDACQIDLQISESADQLLNADARAARSLIEVVRESVTNAIKHNSAKEIDVFVDLSADLIELVISNPGKLEIAKSVGVGSEIISELTHEAKLDQVGPMVVLRALIPRSLAAEQ